MKQNYKAWKIQFDNFYEKKPGRDQLEFLLQFAILAPSSHNCQPWKFQVESDCIFIKPDLNRKLLISDPENRHLYISLGCVVENLLIAADFYNFKTQIIYLPPENKDTAVKIYFQLLDKNKFLEKHLIYSIVTRRSNRNKYLSTIPNKDFLTKVQQLSCNDVEISIITQQEEKNNITDILMDSRFKAFSNKAFRTEMSEYKKNNFTSSPFGMPGFTLGISDILSLIAPFLIKNFNIMRVIGRTEKAILKKYTPVFIFLNAKEHSTLGWIKTGQILQRLLLEAENNLVQASISAVPLNITPLQKILKTTFRPEMFIRLGYSKIIPGHSPRLNAIQTIEK